MIKNWSYSDEYKSLRNKILKKIDNILKSGKLLFGSELKKFEKSFSKKYNLKYCVGVANGTDALELSLKALNLNKDDEVLIPANTAIPTIAAIINSGLKPRFADIGDDYLIDPYKLQNYINRNTKVIIPVHLYGQACNMSKIVKIAKKNKIKIIEDCAQAQGAKHKNKFVGSFGIAGCFSFYPTKILGSYGDGGLISTNDKNFYKKITRLRFYGIETIDKKHTKYNQYYSNENGKNSRLSEVQAGILNLKFPYLNKWIKKRRDIAHYYEKKIKNNKIIKPQNNQSNFHVYHLYVISCEKRGKIVKLFKKNNIQTSIQYPYPLHKMHAYKNYICQNCNCLKISEKKSKKILSLPIYPYVQKKELDKIINILNSI